MLLRRPNQAWKAGFQRQATAVIAACPAASVAGARCFFIGFRFRITLRAARKRERAYQLLQRLRVETARRDTQVLKNDQQPLYILPQEKKAEK